MTMLLINLLFVIKSVDAYDTLAVFKNVWNDIHVSLYVTAI